MILINLLKSISITTFVNWFSKAITIFINLCSIRFISDYLTKKEYALFLLIVSLQSWLVLVDFGIGNSVQNYIIEYRARKKSYDVVIFTSYVIALTLLILFLVTLYIFKDTIAANYLATNAKHLKRDTFLLLTGVGLISLNYVSEIVYKIKYAENLGYRAVLVHLLGRILSFIAILLVPYICIKPDVSIYIVANLLPSALLSFSYYTYHFLKVSHKEFSYQVGIKIIKRGFLFWLFNVVLYLPFYTDYWVINVYLSDKEVIIYNLFKRLYEIPNFAYNAILLVSWVQFSENYLLRDFVLIKSNIRKNLLIGMMILLAAIAMLALFSNYIVSILLSNYNLRVSPHWVLIYGVYFLARIWVDTFTTFLQSINVLVELIIFYALVGILTIFLEIYLTPIAGLYGLALALIFPMLPLAFWLPYKSYSMLKK